MSNVTPRAFTAIPSPPRQTGDSASDSRSLFAWFSTFYQATVLESRLLNPAYQASILPFAADALPDPSDTTIATAQQTANEALREAQRVNRPYQVGTFTISGTADSASIEFEEEAANTEFVVLCQVVDSAGGPTVTSLQIVRITKSRGGFAVLLYGAPGAGKSITYDYAVLLKG